MEEPETPAQQPDSTPPPDESPPDQDEPMFPLPDLDKDLREGNVETEERHDSDE